MNEPLVSPAFGQADLTNCERELIHLAGSIQPHGVLLVLSDPSLEILQASENVDEILGEGVDDLLGCPLSRLGGNIAIRLGQVITSLDLAEPKPFLCHTGFEGGRRHFEGTVHRHSGGGIILELEPISSPLENDDSPSGLMHERLAAAVEKFSGTLSIAALSEAVVHTFRKMNGYDRVMVYKFDPDGHGEIIAEARNPKLDSLLGHRYPASDIPQRARELYVRNRVRVLVDVNYFPVPIVPRRFPLTQEDLDMSLCHLRSMSPLHLQYLRNMGVTGTLVVSLVREGRLWGLVACHHYSPRHVGYEVCAASELLAEVISARIAAIENYVHSQVEVLVRRLELRLIEATSTEGDWRLALFRNPRTLLQPLEASGAALFCDGEVMTAGEVPSSPELRNLLQWVEGRTVDSMFYCSSVARENPALSSCTSTASGVLAFRLSRSRPDYLMWFRKEQLREVTWAGDPAKPVLDNDPLKLSPRRSFAAWSEIVKGTATPWSRAEIVLARAIGNSLVDIILQIQAVRLLISHHQLDRVRSEVSNSNEPVVIGDATGRILYSNESFARLSRRPSLRLEQLEDLALIFANPERVRGRLHELKMNRSSWREELDLVAGNSEAFPVGVRADVIPAQDGSALGYVVILNDLTGRKSAEEARRHFETAIGQTELAEALGDQGSTLSRETAAVLGAIVANANVAAMEIADAAEGLPVAAMLEELEISTKRATALYRQLRDYFGDG